MEAHARFSHATRKHVRATHWHCDMRGTDNGIKDYGNGTDNGIKDYGNGADDDSKGTTASDAWKTALCAHRELTGRAWHAW